VYEKLEADKQKTPPSPQEGALEEPQKRFRRTLSGANFSGAELVTLDLTETRLSGVDSSGTNLSEATANDEQ
jgi:uncharacterized protein YjbI with pentapeptide repeats